MASRKSIKQQAVERILVGQSYRDWKTETLRHIGADLIAGAKSPYTDLVLDKAMDATIAEFVSENTVQGKSATGVRINSHEPGMKESEGEQHGG